MLFGELQGTTDSELMFYLALSYGLMDDPLPALERMAGRIETLGRERGIDEPLQMTIGLSDGERLYAVRYASGPRVNTLYVSSSVDDLKRMYPTSPEVQALSEDSTAVVSEPLESLPGTWHEVPPGTALVVHAGVDREVPFQPQVPV
jgi:glutamine amidotransferase